MKYFTPQLWLGFNSPRSKVAFATWDRRFKAYQTNLKTILPKLNSGARRFFQDALLLHDGTLTKMELGDRIRDTDGKATRGIANRRQLVVRLFVLSDRVDQHCYTLEYKNIDRVEVDYPGKLKLFPIGFSSNLGDWGYDELTSVANGLFRHEILFSSGATITIDFRQISVRRKRAE
ncbi:MAG: hypothetical protein WA305_14935 [Candidatus Acidiferrales bacterium]